MDQIKNKNKERREISTTYKLLFFIIIITSLLSLITLTDYYNGEMKADSKSIVYDLIPTIKLLVNNENDSTYIVVRQASFISKFYGI